MALVSRSLESAEKIRSYSGPIIAIGAVFAILYFGRVFFITSLMAVIIAFILEPFVGLLVRVKMPRAVASFLVCTIALLMVYLMGMGAWAQVSGLLADMPKYSQRITQLVDDVRDRVEKMEQSVYQVVIPARQRRQEVDRQALQQTETARKMRKKGIEVVPPPQPGAIPEVRIHEERNPISDYIYARLSSFYTILLMTSFIPFLVYFMLSWRDHINRSFLQFFHGEDRLIASRSLTGVADMVRAFVVGNFVLGILLALASSIAFWIIHLPYPLLVGPLSGFLSLVPYVGLPLALMPPLFVALPAFSSPSGYVLVIIVVGAAHLIALNVLYPKIVGSRVHLNPLVVTFSLMLWGFLWDAAGLLLAIPLTAAIKAVCDNVKDLRPFGKFLGD